MADRKSLVYKGSIPNHCCCDATLRILPSGEFIVVFITGGNHEPEPENHIRLCRSANQGESWGESEVVQCFEDKACLLTEVTVDEDLITIYGQSHLGYFEDWQDWTITSTDGGRTWSEPKPFAPLPRRTFIRNRIMLPNGDWLLPFQSYELDEGDNLESPLKDGSFKNPYNGVLISSDQGKTWRKSQSIRGGGTWAENNLAVRSDGSIVMFVRNDGTGCIWESISNDGGFSWSELTRTAIPNPGTKFRLFNLRDGRIALIHNPNPGDGKWFTHRNPLALWISDDDMASWNYQRILTDFPGHLQYPDGQLDSTETFIHFAFDYNRHDVIYWGAELPPAAE